MDQEEIKRQLAQNEGTNMRSFKNVLTQRLWCSIVHPPFTISADLYELCLSSGLLISKDMFDTVCCYRPTLLIDKYHVIVIVNRQELVLFFDNSIP